MNYYIVGFLSLSRYFTFSKLFTLICNFLFSSRTGSNFSYLFLYYGLTQFHCLLCISIFIFSDRSWNRSSIFLRVAKRVYLIGSLNFLVGNTCLRLYWRLCLWVNIIFNPNLSAESNCCEISLLCTFCYQ